MSDEIALFEETINEQKVEFEKGLETLGSCGASKRPEQTQKLDLLLKRVKKTLTNYKYHMRNIRDPLTKGQYEKRFREHEQDVSNLERDLATIKQKGASGAVNSGSATPEPDVQYQSTDQVLCQALNIQDQSLAAVARTQQLAAECEQTGNDIVIELRKTTEKAADVAEELNTLHAQMKRAQKDMIWFARNAMGDKCFIIMFLLVIAAVIFIICWKIWGKNFGLTSTTGPPLLPPISNSTFSGNITEPILPPSYNTTMNGTLPYNTTTNGTLPYNTTTATTMNLTSWIWRNLLLDATQRRRQLPNLKFSGP